jgi:hypothetical protein
VSRTPTSRTEEPPTSLAPSAQSGAGQERKSTCPGCAALNAEVQELRTSRDDALLALAKERELLEALRLKYSTAEHYVRMAQEPPLRYVVADKLNHALKDRFEFLHLGAKRVMGFFVRSAKNQG